MYSFVDDYRYLRSRGYPAKGALKLVGDHHRLNTVFRNCLFRAVFSDSDCRNRKAKLAAAGDVGESMFGIDWFNVLITVESYLKGLTVFISQDGFVRDSSGVHGGYKTGKVTERSITEILAVITVLKPSRVELYLDSPISHSGEMAEDLRLRLSHSASPPHLVSVVQSADYPLKSFNGIVATSDSSIIDRKKVKQVFDLAAFVLESRFQAGIPRVGELSENLPVG